MTDKPKVIKNLTSRHTFASATRFTSQTNLRYVVLLRKMYAQTDFMREGFLKRVEKDNFGRWKSKDEDKSFLCKLLNPVYDAIANFIPSNVSPNILSFVGLFTNVLALEWSSRENLDFLDLCVISSMLLFSLLCDKVDGIHARKIWNANPVGELIEQWCVCLSVTLVGSVCCNVFNIIKPDERQLVVILFNLIALVKHMRAFADPNNIVQVGHFTRTGASERYLTLCFMIAARELWLPKFPDFPFYFFTAVVAVGAMSFLHLVWICTRFYSTHRDYTTLFGIGMCFTLQIIKFIRKGVFTNSHDAISAVQTGLMLSTMCADLILAKMAQRQLHPMVRLLVLSLSLFFEENGSNFFNFSIPQSSSCVFALCLPPSVFLNMLVDVGSCVAFDVICLRRFVNPISSALLCYKCPGCGASPQAFHLQPGRQRIGHWLLRWLSRGSRQLDGTFKLALPIHLFYCCVLVHDCAVSYATYAGLV